MYGYNNNLYNRPIGVPTQPLTNQYLQQPIVQPTTIATGLQGKMVDSIEAVKVADTLLDGSTSYYPLLDGSAIITKKLQNDGTTKTTIYKVTEEKEIATPRYATLEDIKSEVEKIDLSDLDDLKEEIKEIRRDLKELKKKKGDE